MPGSAKFMEAYQTALEGVPEAIAVRSSQPKPGSVRAACVAFYASRKFAGLDGSTQNWTRRALDGFAREHGDKALAGMRPKHVRTLRDEKADTPAAANTLLKALRSLFKWARESELMTQDPTEGVDRLSYRSDGFHTWSDEEIAAFEQRHPVGSKARLAFALLLYTSCRREDVIRLGRQHVRNGRIQFVQAKNEDKMPVAIDIPVHQQLSFVLEAATKDNLTFLVTEYGKPFTTAGFGNWFKDRCREAGLPNCTAHGLRKAMARRLAEAGASPHQIMAITGHKTLQQVETYTRAANRSSMADAGFAKLKE